MKFVEWVDSTFYWLVDRELYIFLFSFCIIFGFIFCLGYHILNILEVFDNDAK